MHVAKEISRRSQILECELEEQLLARKSVRQPCPDRLVVSGAALDRMIEDRRI